MCIMYTQIEPILFFVVSISYKKYISPCSKCLGLGITKILKKYNCAIGWSISRHLGIFHQFRSNAGECNSLWNLVKQFPSSTCCIMTVLHRQTYYKLPIAVQGIKKHANYQNPRSTFLTKIIFSYYFCKYIYIYVYIAYQRP